MHTCYHSALKFCLTVCFKKKKNIYIYIYIYIIRPPRVGCPWLLIQYICTILLIGGHSSIRNLRTRHAMVTGTHYIYIYIYTHRTIIFLIALHTCETWSLKLGKKVFENRVLRKILRLERKEVTWEWRKLCNEELNCVYSSPNIILAIRSRRIG